MKRKITKFPSFMQNRANEVELLKDPQSKNLKGYVFDGVDGSQMVLWHGKKAGRVKKHMHDFDEYALVVQGTFRGVVGGKKIKLGPGDECFIPAGVPHEGVYSTNYRAIDAFGGRRLKRLNASK